MNTAAARPPFFRSLLLVAAFTTRRICWNRRTVFMGILLLLPAVLATVIRAEAPPGTVEHFRREVLPTLQLYLVELLCLFYGASILRDSLEDRTLTFLLTRPLGRGQVVAGLWLGMILFVLPVTLVSVFAGFAATRAGVPGGILEDPGMLAALVRLLLVTVVEVLVYGTLFVLLGITNRYPTILGLILMVIVEGVLATVPGHVRRIAPAAYVESLLLPHFSTRASLASGSGGAVSYAVEPGTAILVLGVIFVLSHALIQRAARRRDYLPYHKPE